jgi:hypothetical protein
MPTTRQVVLMVVALRKHAVSSQVIQVMAQYMLIRLRIANVFSPDIMPGPSFQGG